MARHIRGDEFGGAVGISASAAFGPNGTAATDALPFRLDDYAGFTFRGKEIADQDRIIEQIDSGRSINTGGNTISFGFLEKNHTLGVFNNPNYGFPQPNGYTPFSEAQKEATRESMALWDDLIQQDIIEKHGANGADILFANTTTGPAQAAAYYPGNGQKYKGDIWVATPEVNWSNDWLGFGGYGATTIIHEAGHALGLSHPGAYNFGPGFAVTYANGAEYAQDSEQFSIMSYWGPEETGAPLIVDWQTGYYSNAQTPMIHDILTIQSKYGADTTTRADDTVYFSNSTAGRDVFDLEANPYPYLAVYDAGGEDTFDFSDADAGVFVDLRPGSFSSAAADMPSAAEANAARAELDAILPGAPLAPRTDAQMAALEATYKPVYASYIEADTGIGGVMAMSHSNISIAYGTIIENAIGSSERDYLLGNHVANELTGNGGNDVLDGLEGADTLWGNAGNDTFQFSVIETGDRIEDFAAGDLIDLRETGVNFTFIADAAFSNTAGELRYADGMLQGDANGDGVVDFSVALTNGYALGAGDLLLS